MSLNPVVDPAPRSNRSCEVAPSAPEADQHDAEEDGDRSPIPPPGTYLRGEQRIAARKFLAAKYASGATIDGLAEEIGRSRRFVGRLLHESDVVVRSRNDRTFHIRRSGPTPLVRNVASSIRLVLRNPSHPWHKDFPIDVAMAKHFAVGKAAVEAAKNILLQEGVLEYRYVGNAVRKMPVTRQRLSRQARSGSENRERGLASKTRLEQVTGHTRATVADYFEEQILSGDMTVLPNRATLSKHFGLHAVHCSSVLRELRWRGLIKKGRPPGVQGPVRWQVTPQNYIPATFRPLEKPLVDTLRTAIVKEMIRRIDTGWYRYRGLDGLVYERPIGNRSDLASQFRTTHYTMKWVVEELIRLGYLASWRRGADVELAPVLPRRALRLFDQRGNARLRRERPQPSSLGRAG